ncbi:MAG: MarR family transcriptional regulator [Kiritimatiellae bacterium]|nr:MarR family transcriptional regulator [Kiritimatiellia bacterium]
MNSKKAERQILTKWIGICGKIISKYYSFYKNAPYPKSVMEILMHLNEVSNVHEPSHIADKFSIPRQTMTSLIDYMVKHELAVRIPHKSDRRRIQIDITDKGKKVANDFHDRIIEEYQLSMNVKKHKDILENLSVALTLIEEIQKENK